MLYIIATPVGDTHRVYQAARAPIHDALDRGVPWDRTPPEPVLLAERHDCGYLAAALYYCPGGPPRDPGRRMTTWATGDEPVKIRRATAQEAREFLAGATPEYVGAGELPASARMRLPFIRAFTGEWVTRTTPLLIDVLACGALVPERMPRAEEVTA